MGHGGEFWQNTVHWRREWQTTSTFLPWEPHEQYEKTKRYDTGRWTPQVGRCLICYWRRMEKWLQIEWSTGAKAKTTPSCGCDWWWKSIQCCKEQYWIGTRNVRSMNQGKLEVVKQMIARANINFLGISELKWVNIIQMTIISTTVGRNPLEEMK